jgi:hypothetical protein
VVVIVFAQYVVEDFLLFHVVRGSQFAEAEPLVTFLMNLSTTIVLPRYKGVIDFEE